MATLVKLKRDLEFTGKIAEMVDIFKGVAISEFRHLQNRRRQFDKFSRELDRIFSAVVFENPPHPFVVKDSSRPRGLVMVTSDEGFLGEYNSAIVNFALNQRKRDDELIVLGERGSR